MNYPLTTNHFQVEWGGTRIGFTEVTGLSLGMVPINYREGNYKEFSPQQMPGPLVHMNIILKRGIKKGDNEFYNWLNTLQHNQIERRDLLISLLNENHEPVIVWKFKKAFPIKIEWSPLKANGSEPATESIEIAHEGMQVQND